MTFKLVEVTDDLLELFDSYNQMFENKLTFSCVLLNESLDNVPVPVYLVLSRCDGLMYGFYTTGDIIDTGRLFCFGRLH